jgi:hypothetical protein
MPDGSPITTEYQRHEIPDAPRVGPIFDLAGSGKGQALWHYVE